MQVHIQRNVCCLGRTVKYMNIRTVTAATDNIQEEVPLKSWKEIPGPSSLPIIGPLLNLLPGGSLYNLKGIDLTSKLYNTYGPIVRLGSIPGMPPLIFLYDAESAAQVLRGENWLPRRPGFKSLEYYRHEYKPNATRDKATGLITDDGEVWKEFRSTVNPVMLQPKTIKLYTSTINDVADEMIERLRKLNEDNIRSNLDQEMNLWALESIAVVALGCRLNCLDPNLPEDSPARKLTHAVHDLFIVANELDFKPSLWRFIATPTFKKAMKLYEEQEKLSSFFIDQAIENLKTNKRTDDEKGILEKLLDLNKEYAIIMANDMLFAGVDTTANTIIATLYLLAKNSEKQDKLREEVLSNNYKRPYLKACIKEALRMMPIASGNLRLTTKEYSILGYRLPSNIQVILANHDMSLMDKYFNRPNEFIPERWITEKDDPLNYKNAHAFAYAPFGFGVRSCIGRRIAELQLETLLSKLVKNFHFQWSGPPIKVQQSSLNYMRAPFNFIIKDIKN